MRPSKILPVAALALAACSGGGKPDQPAIEKAWVRLAAVPDRPAAAYFTVHGGASGTEVGSVTSPQVQRVELHDTTSSGGMMTMAPLKSVVVPSGGSVSFAPGGRHAMLFGVDPAVKPGGTLTLRFILKPQQELDVQAQVIGAGDAPPAAH